MKRTEDLRVNALSPIVAPEDLRTLRRLGADLVWNISSPLPYTFANVDECHPKAGRGAHLRDSAAHLSSPDHDHVLHGFLLVVRRCAEPGTPPGYSG